MLASDKKPPGDLSMDARREWVLDNLKGVIHPVAAAAATPACDPTEVVDAIVVRAEADLITGRAWIQGDLAVVLALSGSCPFFFNPPLALQMLYRVAWLEGTLEEVLQKGKKDVTFAGVVLAKDKLGVRHKLSEEEIANSASNHLVIHGLPLRLTESAVKKILVAIGAPDGEVSRETAGWKLICKSSFPVTCAAHGCFEWSEVPHPIRHVERDLPSRSQGSAADGPRARSGSARRRKGKGKGPKKEGPTDELDDAKFEEPPRFGATPPSSGSKPKPKPGPAANLVDATALGAQMHPCSSLCSA
eukprot:6162069-Amphidinium_carterae.6